MNDLKFDLDDIVIKPAEGSDITSRSECCEYLKFNGIYMLPLMAAPMDTVISNNNYIDFITNDIIPCLPRRNINTKNYPLFNNNQYFQAFGLCEIENQLNNDFDRIQSSLDYNNIVTWRSFCNYPNVLIDTANGHMNKLIDIVKVIKIRWPHMNLMVGNVANPETFANLGLAGADYVRISIGTGAGCTTAANVSINYPMGSLIEECRKQKNQLDLKTKIVADGGMKNYSDIIKALALGCFLPTTLVCTKKGFKQIQNIQINDFVYTHTGQYKKVINKFKYINEKDIININGIYSTSNHHYYVIHKKHKNFVNDKNIFDYGEWVSAENLTSDYLLIEKNIKLPLRVIMYLKKSFLKIFILYKTIRGELYEKKN